MPTTAQRLQAFLGAWDAQPVGPGPASAMACHRTFGASPGGGFVAMTANWQTGGGPYEEVAVFSLNQTG